MPSVKDLNQEIQKFCFFIVKLVFHEIDFLIKINFHYRSDTQIYSPVGKSKHEGPAHIPAFPPIAVTCPLVIAAGLGVSPVRDLF